MRIATSVLVIAVLAGCFGPPHPEGNATTTRTTTAPPTDINCPPVCFEGHELRLMVDVGGNGAVGIPFPHGAWCLQPEDWNVTSSDESTAEVRMSDRGQVLWVQNLGHGTAKAVIDVKDRATCQTLRYDPWSIEPDPADGTLDVNATAAGLDVEVQVQDVDGACFNATVYRGSTVTGWTTFEGLVTGLRCG